MPSSPVFEKHGGRAAINFCLVTALLVVFYAEEQYLAEAWARLEPAIARVLCARRAGCLFRPLIHATGLVLFLVFDDRNTQFIYFQF